MFGFGQKPRVENLGVEDIRKGLADNSILLVDVREPNEWEAGHIPGSILMPLSSFDAAELPDAAGRRIVFSCRSGNRSMKAAAQAQDAGVPVDAHYAGGFLDWVAQGGPVETGA
ncbi:rhodanese-like domain-containing protein [Alsobacter sp. SYSU M60028]|uniref:Rhodanese-like domain-containing protein n=1 Tax=Alsobacter ponti TaxID=2962936 RepID=A0ABT1L963_9HYPH|nr:rhodanese-like domain-containing protein [Alsobacter ponti]MCP8937280.1 rhodanese-like domain-containing protein [Alsobacter ponti]